MAVSMITNDGNRDTNRRRTPPSNEALRHSGGARRLCTSATVTLYLDVELRSDRRPGTEQNRSVCAIGPPPTDQSFSDFFTLTAHRHNTSPLYKQLIWLRTKMAETVRTNLAVKIFKNSIHLYII